MFVSVCMCACVCFVCVCVRARVYVCVLIFFSVKDFLETTASRILKFGTIIGYDILYCERVNQHPHAFSSLYLSIFLSFQ